MVDQDLINELMNDFSDFSRKADYYNSYFAGKAMPKMMSAAMPIDLRIFNMVHNISRVVIQSYVERIQVTGFQSQSDSKVTDEIWDWWKQNNLPAESALAHIEALVTGKAYIVVGMGDEPGDPPIITVETGSTLKTKINPRTRAVEAALRQYDLDEAGLPRRVTLYLPNETKYFIKKNNNWIKDSDFETNVHNLGECLVVPIINRARIEERDGRSEIADIIPLQDAACRALSNLQVAQEVMATPSRAIVGADQEDFIDPATGATNPLVQQALGSMLVFQNENAKITQFAAAQLDNYTNTIMFYHRMVSALTGVPLRHFGVAGDVNGSSGDAVREDDSKLNRKCETFGDSFSVCWAKAMGLAYRLVKGDSKELLTLEALMLNPATYTLGARADAAVKLFGAVGADGKPLFSRRGTWEELGKSQEWMDREEERLKEEDALVEALREDQRDSESVQQSDEASGDQPPEEADADSEPVPK